ncbi:MAG: DUF938 domain-containing protein [Pseudomonadota bacterium]
MTSKRDTPTFHRNHDAIVQAMRRDLPGDSVGRGLEIGSGSGQHVIGLARAWPGVTWQPSDISTANLASIAAWRADAWAEGIENCAPPLHLDVTDADAATLGRLDVIISINVIHIAPWAATEGIFALAGASLSAGGRVFFYGPFVDSETPIAPSNVAFDARLRAEDPRWGVRSLTDLDAVAAGHGLRRRATHEVPANNLVLVYERCATDAG